MSDSFCSRLSFFRRCAWERDPVFCILTALALLAGMTFLYVREEMFWIFTVLSTLFWGYISGFIMQDIAGDRIWGTFIGLIVGAAAFVLHLYARNQMTQQN